VQPTAARRRFNQMHGDLRALDVSLTILPQELSGNAWKGTTAT